MQRMMPRPGRPFSRLLCQWQRQSEFGLNGLRRIDGRGLQALPRQFYLRPTLRDCRVYSRPTLTVVLGNVCWPRRRLSDHNR